MNIEKVSDPHYDIFLSHSSLDKPFVSKLAEMIENEKYGDRNLKVFFDIWDIKAGDNIVLRLEEGLKKSRFVAIILSANSINAKWPEMEWTIAVSVDPSGRNGTVIPIWLGGCEIPASLKIRNVLYCRNEEEFKRSYTKLIAILTDKSLPRGKKIERLDINGESTFEKFPLVFEDETHEQLASNLLPVKNLPKKIWSGPTTFSPSEVFQFLVENVKGIHPTYLIKDKRIYCFWNLNDRACPFRRILSGDMIEEYLTNEWLEFEEKSTWLVEMLNKALRNHCWDLNIKFDPEHKRFYFPPLGGADRDIQWNTGKRKATRKVTAKHINHSTKRVFWSHQALKSRFFVLDKKLFLMLIPGWTFTEDGERPIPQSEMGPLSTKWTTREHNPSVFYHVRFWSNILSRSKEEIELPLGDSFCIIDINPAVIELTTGLSDDQDPIDKVFEIADEEITSSALMRDAIIERGTLDDQEETDYE